MGNYDYIKSGVGASKGGSSMVDPLTAATAAANFAGSLFGGGESKAEKSQGIREEDKARYLRAIRPEFIQALQRLSSSMRGPGNMDIFGSHLMRRAAGDKAGQMTGRISLEDAVNKMSPVKTPTERDYSRFSLMSQGQFLPWESDAQDSARRHPPKPTNVSGMMGKLRGMQGLLKGRRP
jgi:hypothetical protein